MGKGQMATDAVGIKFLGMKYDMFYTTPTGSQICRNEIWYVLYDPDGVAGLYEWNMICFIRPHRGRRFIGMKYDLVYTTPTGSQIYRNEINFTHITKNHYGNSAKRNRTRIIERKGFVSVRKRAFIFQIFTRKKSNKENLHNLWFGYKLGLCLLFKYLKFV